MNSSPCEDSTLGEEDSWETRHSLKAHNTLSGDCYKGKKKRSWESQGRMGNFLKRFLFWCGPFFKASIEFVAILLLFHVLFFFWLWGMWDLTSLTRYWTHTLCIRSRNLNHRTAREVPCALLEMVVYSRKETKTSMTGEERERHSGRRWSCASGQEAGHANP